MSTPLLSLRGVTRTFTVKKGLFAEAARLTAVDAADLDIYPGEPLGLVGESGCGKSTLGRIVAGLLPPTAGEVCWHAEKNEAEQDRIARTAETARAAHAAKTAPSPEATETAHVAATKATPAKSAQPHRRLCGRVQMIFQDPFSSLNPRMTVGASIAEPLAIRGLTRQEQQKKTKAMLELVGLSAVQARRFPHEFSGGQRQRIAVARALITHPELIVCDEPVSALDASVQAQVLNLLRDVQERFNPAYLFISHDLAVVGFLCRRIAVMYLGQIMEEGPRDVLLSQPAHPYTQALLAAMPRHDPALRTRSVLPGELPSPLHPPCGCPFHPRCAHALPRCAHTPAPWISLRSGHKARCHLLG